MTGPEIDRSLRDKWASQQPRAKRRSKLKARFGGRLTAEIRRTQEKLWLLIELRTEQEQREINEAAAAPRLPAPPDQA